MFHCNFHSCVNGFENRQWKMKFDLNFNANIKKNCQCQFALDLPFFQRKFWTEPEINKHSSS